MSALIFFFTFSTPYDTIIRSTTFKSSQNVNLLALTSDQRIAAHFFFSTNSP